MSAIMILNAQRVNAQSSPVAPASMSSDVPSQDPSDYEANGSVGESGALGYLFGADPFEWVPTHLEQTSDAPLVDVSTAEAMKYDSVEPELSVGVDPHHVQTVEAKPAAGFNLAANLRDQVASFMNRDSLFAGGGDHVGE